MGLFIKKTTRAALERGKVIGSYAVLCICILLIAVNIATFLFFPRLAMPLAILLSNAITLILAIIAFRPINRLIERLLEKRQQELLEQKAREEALEEQVDRLSSRNRELESRLDTRTQTAAMPGELDFTFKLEQMEFSKKGYVVKEESLDTFRVDDRFKEMIPNVNLFEKMLDALMMKEQGVRKILYIRKYYYKVSIGIDFSRIKFTFVDDRILFSGVKFSRLHDISSELSPDAGDINHCWIINTVDEWAEIKHTAYYDLFKDAYTRMQDAETHDSLEAEVESLCQQYTAIFRRNIQLRFPLVDFVESIEESELSWYALREGARYQMVRDVASNMLLLTNVMGETKAVEDQFDD